MTTEHGSARRHLLAIVLAAGESARMGRPKQTLRYQGVPLVRRAAETAGAVCGSSVVVVTGAYRESVERCLEGCGVRLVYNAGWRSGLASSLGAGVAAADPDCEAVLVLACDQPAITSKDLGMLVDAWRKRPDRPAAAAYDQVAGIPAIFPASLFSELRTLRGSHGARGLLRGADPITPVPMASAALDLDAPADLDQLGGRPAVTGKSWAR